MTAFVLVFLAEKDSQHKIVFTAKLSFVLGQTLNVPITMPFATVAI